jgi:acyl carrier protein
MELNDFVKHFAEQFENTAISQFAPETRFRDLEEWDSVHALIIMALVNEKYKVKITPEELKNCQVIAEVFEVVKAKIQHL